MPLKHARKVTRRKKCEKLFKFYCHVYHVEYLVMAGGSFERFKRRCDAFLGCDSEITEGGCTAKTVIHTAKPKIAFYFKYRPIPADTLAHEAFHAVYAVMNGKGVVLNDGSEETFTYYLAWIVNQIGRKCGSMDVNYIGRSR